jgi:hypothetical protein
MVPHRIRTPAMKQTEFATILRHKPDLNKGNDFALESAAVFSNRSRW